MALALLVALQSAVLSAAPSVAGKRIKDSTGALSMVVPKDWSVEKTMADCQKLNIVGPSHKGLCSDITLVTKNGENLTLDIVSKGVEQDPSKLDRGCKIISHSKTKLGGAPALVYVFESAPVPNMPTTWSEVRISIKNKTAYLLTFSASKEFFKTDRAVFETVLKSFKWLK